MKVYLPRFPVCNSFLLLHVLPLMLLLFVSAITVMSDRLSSISTFFLPEYKRLVCHWWSNQLHPDIEESLSYIGYMMDRFVIVFGWILTCRLATSSLAYHDNCLVLFNKIQYLTTYKDHYNFSYEAMTRSVSQTYVVWRQEVVRVVAWLSSGGIAVLHGRSRPCRSRLQWLDQLNYLDERVSNWIYWRRTTLLPGATVPGFQNAIGVCVLSWIECSRHQKERSCQKQKSQLKLSVHEL